MCFLQHTDADVFVVQYECSGLFIHMHESQDLEVKAGVPASVLYRCNHTTGKLVGVHMQGMMKARLYTPSVSDRGSRRD